MRALRIVGVVLSALTLLLASVHAQTSIQYVYDELGRLISVIVPGGDTAVYHYDAVGNVLSIDRHATSQVSIIWFSPASAPTGTTVTISGTGFSTTPSQNTVTFNSTAATVSSATSTQLIVTVPSGATTGTIGVTAPAGSASSATAFTVAASTAPSITGFSPAIGPVGTVVSITGTNFDPAPANDNLRFHLKHAFVTTASGTSLTATIPTGTTTGRLRVTTPLGTTLSANDFFIPPSPYVASDVIATARVTPTGTLTVSVPTANKVALIAFDGVVNQRISLNITSSSVPSYYVFYKPDGSQLSSDYRGGTGFIDVKTLSLAGTHVLMIDPNGTSTGSATMTLWDVPPDWTGAIVPGGNSVTVSTTAPGQNAQLSFSGSANQRVSLQITGGTLPAYYVFYKPDGSQLSSDYWNGGAGGFIDTKTLPVAGTYALVVDGNSASTGTSTLKLNDVPADFSGTITADGQPVTATTTVPGQNAGLTFSGTANQRVSIRLTNSTLPGYYQLYKPDGSQLSSDYRGGSTGFIDVKTLPTSGTYTLKVDGYGSAYGSTTLYLYTVVDGTGSVDIGGSAQTVSITTPGQNATYTMAGTASQSATVRIASNTMGYVTVTLKKPDGTTLTSSGSSAASFNLSTQTLPVTGTYTIVVDPQDANTGSLSLSVTSP